MTEKREVWVHGTAVQVEYPDKLESYVRKGWGTRYTGKFNSKNWFHFSIPTPALVDGFYPILRKVYVLYNDKNFPLAGGGIQNVHIYDGPKKLFAFDNLNPDYSGDHSKQIDEFNCWDVGENYKWIRLGLGISVGVVFRAGGDLGGITEISFTAAGAEFTYEEVNLIGQPRL